MPHDIRHHNAGPHSRPHVNWPRIRCHDPCGHSNFWRHDGGLDHRVLEADLTIAGHHGLAFAAHLEDGGGTYRAHEAGSVSGPVKLLEAML